MFDISWGELILIGMVALIVIGPKELPTVLRTMGQYMTKIRRMAADFQGQFNEAMREAEMADLKNQVDGLRDTAKGFNPIQTIRDEFQSAKSQFDAATKDVGVSSADLTPSAGSTPTASIDVPMPEMPPPVSSADFATPPPETPSAPAATNPAPAAPEPHPERAALDGAPAAPPKSGSAA